MIRKFIIRILLLCTFLCGAGVCAAQVHQPQDSTAGQAASLDTAVCNALDSKLMEYFEAIKHEPVDVQKAECDFLIASTNDSLVRNHVPRPYMTTILTVP